MPHLFALLLLGMAAGTRLLGAEGVRDPEFDKVPFEQWFSGGEQTQLKWTERTLPLLLSIHQRLMARVQVQLDGAEAAKRKGEGELVFYFQVSDAQGRIYQDHTSYDLAKVEEGMRAQDMNLTESAFVLPGDYSVRLAIYDTATKEHSAKKTRLHIAPLKIDPLPDAWRNLPPVEFLESSEGPDHWFLPKEKGKLNLPLTLRRPVRVDVLVNLTPTQEHLRTYGIQDRNLSIIVPALKVLAEMTAPGLELNAGLIDLSRRRVMFHQEGVHELDWDKMKAALPRANAGSIDVKSLADRRHNAAFLGSEIERRFGSGEQRQQGRVVIVLSGPMVFETGQELLQPLARPSADCRFFYIRVQIPPDRVIIPSTEMGRRRGLGGFGGFGGPGGGRSRMPPEDEQTTLSQDLDQLEPLLKPLDPHVFDVMTAEQFRKALASIMSEISGL